MPHFVDEPMPIQIVIVADILADLRVTALEGVLLAQFPFYILVATRSYHVLVGVLEVVALLVQVLHRLVARVQKGLGVIDFQ